MSGSVANIPPYRTIDIEGGWPHLRDELERLSQTQGWIFRGQRCASWGLKTSLERHAPRGSSLDIAEQRLLTEFKRRAHTYLAQQAIPENDDEGEWLALMQHFGAPKQSSSSKTICRAPRAHTNPTTTTPASSLGGESGSRKLIPGGSTPATVAWRR